MPPKGRPSQARAPDDELDIEAQGPVGIHGDASVQDRRVILLLEPKGIRAWRQLRDSVGARWVRDRNLLTL